MTDFKKIDNMIEYIESGFLPENRTFNDFAIDFYLETKNLTLSKYIRLKGKSSKLPKIMNTKKAGELLFETEKSEDIKIFLKRNGFESIPELNYTSCMLLRKVENKSNWEKIFIYLKGNRTINEINSSIKKTLFPLEIEQLENYIKKELSLSDQELKWFLNKMQQVKDSKILYKSVNKLLK